MMRLTDTQKSGRGQPNLLGNTSEKNSSHAPKSIDAKYGFFKNFQLDIHIWPGNSVIEYISGWQFESPLSPPFSKNCLLSLPYNNSAILHL